MGSLPEEYEMDYLVYSASSNITEEKIIWDMDYVQVIKRMMFKKFDNWVEFIYLNRDRNG